MGRGLAKTARNAEIIRLAQTGMSHRTIAAQFDVTTSRVWQIVNAASGAPKARGRRVDAMTVFKPKPSTVAWRGPETPFTGDVQVLPGTSPRRPLTMSDAMRANLQRASQAEPSLRSISALAGKAA